MYEQHENEKIPGKTVVESILETSGIRFDAFMIIFKDKLGNGTLEELEAYKNLMLPENPDIEVWWSQIVCPEHDQEVDELLEWLNQTQRTEMPCLAGEECLDTPEKLRTRVTNQIIMSFGRRADV